MRGRPVRQADFSGGLNTKSASYLVAENECRDCRNVVGVTRGAVRKRYGDTTFANTFAGSPLYLTDIFALHQTPSPFLVVIDLNGKTHSISALGAVTDISGGGTINSGSVGVEAPTSGGQGPFYISTLSTPKQWTGTGNVANWTASSGAVPTGNQMVYFGNRMWISGGVGSTSRLYFSGDATGGGLSDPRVWGGGLYVDISADDGQAITALGTAGPYLLVFKTRSLHVVYDLDTGANRVLSSQVGTVWPDTVVESATGTYFLSPDSGVYVTDGNSLQQISAKIDPTINSIIPTQTLYAGVFFNDHYYLSVQTSGGINDLVLDWDSQLQSWWVHTNPMNQYAVWRPDLYTPTLFGVKSALSPIVSKLYQSGINQDNGSNFTASWTGPWLSFGEPYRRKRIRQVHFDGTGVVDAYYSSDFAGAGSLLDDDIFDFGAGTLFGGSGSFGVEGTFGDIPALSEKRLFTEGVCRAMSVQVSGTHSQIMELDAYSPLITPRTN